MVTDKMWNAFTKGMAMIGQGFALIAEACQSFSIFPARERFIPKDYLQDTEGYRRGFAADKEALQSDFRAVGKDMRTILDDLEKGIEQYKKEKMKTSQPGDKP